MRAAPRLLVASLAGMIYFNLPKMVGKQGDRVRFHVFTLGTEDDLHAPSLLASSFLADVRTCLDRYKAILNPTYLLLCAIL